MSLSATREATFMQCFFALDFMYHFTWGESNHTKIFKCLIILCPQCLLREKKLKAFHITWDNSLSGDNWKTQ